jgi:hypothetical protein
MALQPAENKPQSLDGNCERFCRSSGGSARPRQRPLDAVWAERRLSIKTSAY